MLFLDHPKERPKTHPTSVFFRAFILGILVPGCGNTAKSISPSGQPTARPKIDPTTLTCPPTSSPQTLLMIEDVGREVEPVTVKSCPPDMVKVGDKLCVDRYEDVLVDEKERRFSPYYPPAPADALEIYTYWKANYTLEGTDLGNKTAPPRLPQWQIKEIHSPKAVSFFNVLPNAYVSGVMAEQACKEAGKRLCTIDEWRLACGGEAQTKYPYSTAYQEGACNYANLNYPPYLLQGHDPLTLKMSDPRLNTIPNSLGKTGEWETCVSHWGKDRLYDMVGNLDEWVLDPTSTYGRVMVGGSYIRNRRELGCSARIATHYANYRDYTTGVRCCSDIQTEAH